MRLRKNYSIAILQLEKIDMGINTVTGRIEKCLENILEFSKRSSTQHEADIVACLDGSHQHNWIANVATTCSEKGQRLSRVTLSQLLLQPPCRTVDGVRKLSIGDVLISILTRGYNPCCLRLLFRTLVNHSGDQTSAESSIAVDGEATHVECDNSSARRAVHLPDHVENLVQALKQWTFPHSTS